MTTTPTRTTDADSPCLTRHDDWICTRDRGHNGEHIALCSEGNPMATWVQAGAVRLTHPTAPPEIRIRDITFEHAEGPLDFREVELPQVETGSDYGRLMVRLAVDGQRTQIYADLGQTGTLDAIKTAIDMLEQLESDLTGLVGSRTRPGRCMGSGDWGRCTSASDHDGDHVFPTEAEWATEQKVLGR